MESNDAQLEERLTALEPTRCSWSSRVVSKLEVLIRTGDDGIAEVCYLPG